MAKATSKKGGCSSCKKKPPITELPPVVEEHVWVPTLEEIKLAYVELSNMKGVLESKKEMIAKVYQFLFNEKLDFTCRSCVSNQGMKFHNYMKYTLKEDV
jgi:hypothetical protein